jgi:hypothetical protein
VPDQLSDRLAALAEDVGRVARPAPASVVRRRGETRYRIRLAVAAITGGVAALTAGSVMAASLPAAPAPTGPGPEALPTQISPEFRMPHDGEVGWVSDDNPSAPGAFNPCGGPDVTLVGRTDAITVTGSSLGFTDQLLLFVSESAAQGAFVSLAKDMHECGWGGGADPYTPYGRLWLHAYRTTDGSPQTRDEWLEVTLRRNAMIILYGLGGGETPVWSDHEALGPIVTGLCSIMGICEELVCYADPIPSPGDGRPAPEQSPCPGPSVMAPGASSFDSFTMQPTEYASPGSGGWDSPPPGYSPSPPAGGPSASL